MNSISRYLRNFFRKGQNNVIKVLSLGVGLAMGLVLIAKVYLDSSYDNFIPDGERIYQIQTNVKMGDEEEKDYNQVSGAIAPGMKENIPEVELATRFTHFGNQLAFSTEADPNKYQADFIFADSCFLQLLPRAMRIGNATETLALPMMVLISEELATRMGGIDAAMGQRIEFQAAPGRMLTIGGIFETLPENSHLSYDAIISLASIGQFSWDGRDNWLGNDRYIGYVKLREGCDPNALAPAIRSMQEQHQDIAEIEKMGIKLSYFLLPLRDIHSGSPETKRNQRLMGLLAFAILFTAVMNYILIVISSLVSRSKEMAVNRCYGASDGSIYRLMFTESFLHLVISLTLATLLIVTFRTTISDLLNTSLSALFSWEGSIVLAVVCLVILLVSGFVPGYLYARIPVSSAFRNYTENRRVWKLGLLFVQFVAAGFLVTLLMVVGKQYHFMVNDDTGYSYENLLVASMQGIDQENRRHLLEEIQRLPEVAAVSSCYQLPYDGASGNNIALPEAPDKQLFNVADNYYVGNGYLQLMDIPVIAGRSFTENSPASREVMVSRSFVEKMKLTANWNDGAVGKSILLSEHSQQETDLFTICGVYEDYRKGSIGRIDQRPSVTFYGNFVSDKLLIRLHELTPERTEKINLLLNTLQPTREMTAYSYASEYRAYYEDSRRFRDSVIIGGLAALFITLIGLIGYTNDEMNRRRKETAIRKVNGATMLRLQQLFMGDIARFAIPAVIFAGGIAAYVAMQWLDQFNEKAAISFPLYFICGLFVLTIILTVVTLNCYKVANDNPINSLKSE